MLSFSAVPGYVATVWTAVSATTAYGQQALPTLTSAAASQSLATVIAQSMRNARDNVDAFVLGQALTSLYNNLAPALTFSLGVDATDLAYVTAKVAAVQAAATAVTALPLAPAASPATALTQGQVSVPDCKFLEYLAGVPALEPAPTGVVDNPSFQTALIEEVTAWQNVATALATGGFGVTGATVDAVNTMLAAATTTQAMAAAVVVTVQAPVTAKRIWNGVAVVPTVFAAAAAANLDPTSPGGQQTSALLYLIAKTQDQFNYLALNSRSLPPATVKLATVYQGDTLMVVAARELGNYERWTEIAVLNGLQPPYITSLPTPTTKSPGQKLYVPTTPGTQTAVTTPADYAVNYLGTDIYLGPINQPMTTWTGDFQAISGYQNLSISLGRRLQTRLGSFIFHRAYGSRIPGTVGSVTAGTIGVIGAYARAAILSDPRVAAVTSLTTSIPAPYAVGVTANVRPNGFAADTPVAVNEVLKP